MKTMKWVMNSMAKADHDNLELMDLAEVKKARKFHESFPEYTVTPLAELSNMADFVGVKDIFVKDESYRFGLNAFKVLGGSYSMAKYAASLTGRAIEEMDYNTFISEDFHKELGEITFFTATDGNHGRGVAWAAKRLGQKAVVFMPKGTTQMRLDRIAAEGATVTIEELNYDDCVRKAVTESEKISPSVVVQDTAWDGYEEIPTWIMQGYGTMASEAAEQLEEAKAVPTHIFVQAGVGSLAGAVVGFFVNYYKDAPVKPKLIVVEAQAADCLYKGAVAGDGKPRIVGGDLNTIMAGLACGEPNTISWEILRSYVTAFISAPDWVTELGMRMNGAPLKGDPQVISGESGAVPFGAFATIMLNEEYGELKELLQLNKDSVVLCFSTEGDTDEQRYKEILWEGKNFNL